MRDFDTAIKFVLEQEGGYVNDENDPGGATNFGITQHVYDPTGAEDVKHITNEEIKNIYQNRYWIPGHCDQLPWPFSLMHFDACVNVGQPEFKFSRSIKMLQRAIGATPDGIIGPKTLDRVSLENNDYSWETYFWERMRYYIHISRIKPKLRKFTWIWAARINHLRVRAIYEE